MAALITEVRYVLRPGVVHSHRERAALSLGYEGRGNRGASMLGLLADDLAKHKNLILCLSFLT